MAKTTITCPQCSTHIDLGGLFKDLPDTTTCPVCKTVIDVASVAAKHDESKKGLVSVIKYEGDNDTFIWKHPIEDFNFGSQLIVHESQEAIFFRDGQALDTFGPGRYTLDTQNLPILRGLMALPTNADSLFHSEVYFINKTVQMAVKWGTPDKVRFIDPLTGTPLQIGASGEMNLSVADSRKLLIKLVGTTTGIAWGDDGNGFTKSLQKAFRPLISNAVKTNLPAVIKNNDIDLLEIDEKLDLISDDLKNKVLPGFEEYGLTIPQFYVTSIVLPEDDPNFKRIRELHTITLQTRMAQAEATVRTAQAQAKTQYRTAEEQSAAAIEAARREAELQRQLTETEVAKREAERRIIEAQADTAAMRMQGLTEAEIMKAKGYDQKDVLQAEVQKAYAEGIGNMQISGGAGGVMGDMLGMGVGLSMAGQIAPQIGNMFGGMNPGGIPAQPTVSVQPAADTWQCSCGNTATGMFCNACGNKKPEPKADTWKCNCGNMATGLFCNMCGAKKPDNSTWDCTCGNRGITGNFCNNCGKKRGE
jgi:membrane protease subunit (stomatin/prohibitin family)